jgi:hypothetical protein
MIQLHFEKLSRFDRPAEPCTVAVPFAEGALPSAERVTVFDDHRPLPTQCRATATWPDGSIKWLLVDFLADLPGNAGKTFILRSDAGKPPQPPGPVAFGAKDGTHLIRAGELTVELAGPGERGLFRQCRLGGLTLTAQELVGPVVVDSQGTPWTIQVGPQGWELIETGPLRGVIQTRGRHRDAAGNAWLDFTVRLYAYAGKPWVRLDYQVMHREPAEELVLGGIRLTAAPAVADSATVRTAVARSNYRSRIDQSNVGEALEVSLDAQDLVYESNEQTPETLYGTFWADWNDPSRGGLCATIFQAQQNFPKALKVAGNFLEVQLLPPGGQPLRLIRGMAKTHRVFLHFHGPEASLEDLNVRSLQFQLPDRPTIPPEVYRQAGVFEDVWVDKPVQAVERRLIDLADCRTRAYGILHWGDAPDGGYTAQGRGKGQLVWTNNEYDFPHAAMLMYARTGERRLLDYVLAAAEHWMDVDVCHCSDDPLRFGGHIAHSARHATGAVTVSHQWVQGLLDHYHQTGEAFACETALGIGRNVVRHLERPHLRRPGESSARETGWALRTLVALHQETYDPAWLAPAEFIVRHFQDWQEEYGAWLAPYTDHTLVRVPFMIAIAAVSLTYYWRVRPEKRVAGLIITAVSDLLDNCRLADGRFYYKELPSLRRPGAGLHVLEALAAAYEVSGDVKFLKAGLQEFQLIIAGVHGFPTVGGVKRAEEDAVILPGGPGPKAFGAGFGPLMSFYRAAATAGLLT